MIFPTGPVRVMVAVQPVDFRKGIDGLAAIVKEELGTDPYSGVVLISKRLEDGKFRWPRVEAGVMRLSPAQLTTLFEGLDWTRCMCGVCARRTKCCDRSMLTRDIGDHKSVGM